MPPAWACSMGTLPTHSPCHLRTHALATNCITSHHTTIRHTALQVGDVLLKVNGNDVTGSSYDETIAAIVLSTTPVFTVKRDTSPVSDTGDSG